MTSSTSVLATLRLAALLAVAAGASCTAAEKITVRIASDHPPEVIRRTEDLAEVFQQRHPGVAVRLEHRRAGPKCLLQQLYAGDTPDIIEVPLWAAVELAARGATRLPDDLRTQATERIYPDIIRACRPGELPQPVGLPWIADTIQFIYRADAFPRPPLIAGDLPKLCELIDEDPGPPFPVGTAAAPADACRTFSVMLCRTGDEGLYVDRVTSNGSLDQAGVNRFLGVDPETGTRKTKINFNSGRDALAALFELKPFAPPESHHTTRHDLIEQFASGRILSMFGDLKDLQAIRCISPELNIAVVPPPVIDTSTSAGSISVLVFPKGSNKEAAIKFADFLISRPAQRLIMRGGDSNEPHALPVLSELSTDEWYRRSENRLYRPFVRGLNDCMPIWPTASWKMASQRILGDELSAIIAQERKSGDEISLAGAERAVNHVLSSYYDQMDYPGWTRAIGWVVGVVLFFTMIFAIGHRG